MVRFVADVIGHIPLSWKTTLPRIGRLVGSASPSS